MMRVFYKKVEKRDCMKIRRKIMLSLSILIVIILGISTFSYLQLKQVSETYDGMIHLELEGIYATSQIQYNMALQNVYIHQYMLEPSAGNLSQLEDIQQVISENVSDLQQLAKTEEIAQRVEQVGQFQASVTEATVAMKELMLQQKEQEAIELVTTNVKSANDIAQMTIEEILAIIKSRFSETAVETNQGVNEMLLILSAIALFSLVSALVIAYKLNKGIAVPLQKLVAFARKIAVGDLTAEDLPKKSNDEVGQLTTAFEQMRHSLHSMVKVFQDNAMDLSAISEQLSASTHLVAETSTNVAGNIEQISIGSKQSAVIAQDTSVAMKQSSQGVQEIVQTTQTIFEQAKETTKLAEKGEARIVQAKEQMRVIYESTKGTALLVQKLTAQSKEIQSMTKVITEITEQTNLLALNAAIEEARAGVQGKGFAVVASEVKKLAEQSKLSADMIGQLTTDILVETKRVEESMALGVSNVESGVEVINESRQIFNEIMTSFDYMTENIAMITSVTEQMVSSTEQVTASTIDLSEHVKEMATSTEVIAQQIEEQTATIQEVNAVSENLSQKSMSLANVVKDYKLTN